MKSSIEFTEQNLIDNIEKLGPWSSYGLAVEALRHYFPQEFDLSEDGDFFHQKGTLEEVKLMEKLGCHYWHELVIKYHNEFGFKGNENGAFDKRCVNEA